MIGCYPFQTHDPFILQACPHVFFIGNQPQFKTAVVEGGESPFKLNGTDMEIPESSEVKAPTQVRLITIPKFHEFQEELTGKVYCDVMGQRPFVH